MYKSFIFGVSHFKGKYFGPPGGGRIKQISEKEEEIKVLYCLALKNEEEIRKRWGKK